MYTVMMETLGEANRTAGGTIKSHDVAKIRPLFVDVATAYKDVVPKGERGV
jgi:hypothetical protein